MLIEESIQGILEGEHEVESGIMFILSVCAFLLNILKICIAGGHSHGGGGHGAKKGHGHAGKSHSHGGKSHGEHGPKKEEKKDGPETAQAAGVKVAFINLFGDVFKSFGIIILSIVLYKWDHLGILDPIYTLVVSILVILSTFGLTKDTFKILIEAVPNDVDLKTVIKSIKGVSGVRQIVDLHVWSMAEGKAALICHIVCSLGSDHTKILKAVTEVCHDNKIFH